MNYHADNKKGFQFSVTGLIGHLVSYFANFFIVFDYFMNMKCLILL